MKIDSIYAVSPVPFPDIDGKILGGRERVLATAAYASGPAERLDPTKYRLAPIKVAQSVHVIYLISPAK